MKFTARQHWLIAGLAMGVIGSSSLAQVAPPPTKPAKEEPAYEPAEKPAAPTQQTAQPTTQINPQPVRQPSSKTQQLPTNTPYPKLARKDETGRIVRLVELPDILALRSNPTVGPKSVESIMPVLYGRRARFERMVVDNLDLYWMVTDGRLQDLNFNDMKSLAEITEMIKPLVGLTSLSKELLNRGILTRTQGGMNEYIVNEYKQAVTAEIQFEYDEPMGEIMKFILEDSIHETTQAYNAMIAETSVKVADIVEELGLSSPEAQALAKLQKPLNEDPDTQHMELEEFDNAFRKLSYEDGIAILLAMREKRSNPDISPFIHVIDVLHDRKVDISDTDAMKGRIEYQDGRSFTTDELKAKTDAKKQAELEEFKKASEGKKSKDDD